jgi:hypothetical protein
MGKLGIVGGGGTVNGKRHDAKEEDMTQKKKVELFYF